MGVERIRIMQTKSRRDLHGSAGKRRPWFLCAAVLCHFPSTSSNFIISITFILDQVDSVKMGSVSRFFRFPRPEVSLPR